jgi:hypothetical protein
MLTKRSIGVVASLITLLSMVACDGDNAPATAIGSAEPTETAPAATLEATPTDGAPTAVAQRPTPSASASPTITATVPPAFTPEELAALNARRTGVVEVDRVIDALFDADQAALDALIRTQAAVCHEEPLGLGDLEVCPEGVPAGTTVEFFPRGSCHGYAQHDQPYYRTLDAATVLLIAVVVLPAPDTVYEHWPAGEYFLVFAAADGEPAGARGVYVEGGELVRSQDGCNSVASLLARGGESPEYLLEPIVEPD